MANKTDEKVNTPPVAEGEDSTQGKPKKKNIIKATIEKVKSKTTKKSSSESDGKGKKHDGKEPKKKKKSQGRGIKFLGGLLFSKMAKGGAAELRSNSEKVNQLNVFPVPDGDTGDNMRMTIESGIAAIENLESDDLAEVMKVLSHGMLLGARGNSGVILSQFFAGTAKGFEGVEKADPAALGKALEMGVAQAYGSVMTPTEGTILTVAREAVEYAVSRINPESTVRTFFADLVKEMYDSVERTPEILTVLKEADVVDSGGAGLFFIMDGFNRVLNGEQPENLDITGGEYKLQPKQLDTGCFGPDSEMEFGYCTELLVQLMRSKCDIDAFDVEELKAFLGSIGDSVVAFKTDSIVKIHVHTHTPDRVLNHCLGFGEFITVKIENMSVQHSASEVEKEVKNDDTPPAPKKKNGAVAVCSGDGVIDLYNQLGVDVVIRGGQTQNPSAGDFIDAFEKINAEHIFVLPNNGNIMMAAAQAAEMYDGANIHVIPSKSVAKGYVALSLIDLENMEPADIESEMTAAVGRVTAGYVSPSIRDAEIGGVHIEDGDTIGVIEKEIVVSERERGVAALALANRLLSEDGRFMLTVFSGKDTTEEEQSELLNAIRRDNPGAEIYFIWGGQDIYPYIYVCE